MRSKLTGYDVGALLYCPANAHGSIVGAIVEQRFPTPYSLAFCLEDTVREDAVADAERMLRGTLSRIAGPVTGAAAAAGGGVRPVFLHSPWIHPAQVFPGELRGLSCSHPLHRPDGGVLLYAGV